MEFQREQLKQALTEAARRNMFVGTSSWKYPGWCEMLYEEARYIYRGKFSEARFNRNCLGEYAEVFKTVCVDAGYYRFPTPKYIEGLVKEVPEDFKFSFKVTDEITIKKFTNLPRHGPMAGKPNPNFLNPDLFQTGFLKPCEPFRQNIGLLMFEFSRFYSSDYERGRDFVEDLDRFLGALPRDWQYGVEMRNPSFLQPAYFEVLQRHGVAHVYNNWQRMPPVSEQMQMEGSRTCSEFTGSRFLLTPGRAYKEAVEGFAPYNQTKKVDQDARKAGAALIAAPGTKPSFLYVNNRLEGNSLLTIQAMLREAGLFEG